MIMLLREIVHNQVDVYECQMHVRTVIYQNQLSIDLHSHVSTMIYYLNFQILVIQTLKLKFKMKFFIQLPQTETDILHNFTSDFRHSKPTEQL